MFQVLWFVSKMDFGVLMCVLVATVDVKRWWVWILECLAVVSGSFVDFSRFMGLIWVVLGGLLCGWWWVLVFCWDCSGGSIVFFFWYGLWPCGWCWQVAMGRVWKSGEDLLSKIERWKRWERFFFLKYIYICIYLCSLYYFNKLYEKLETGIYS